MPPTAAIPRRRSIKCVLLLFMNLYTSLHFINQMLYLRRNSRCHHLIRQILQQNTPRSQNAFFAYMNSINYGSTNTNPRLWPYMSLSSDFCTRREMRICIDRAFVLHDCAAVDNTPSFQLGSCIYNRTSIHKYAIGDLRGGTDDRVRMNQRNQIKPRVF